MIRCPVLNNLEEIVLLPDLVVESVKKNSGVTHPVWPLGIYVIFVEDGMGLGIFGINEERKLVNGVSFLAMTEEQIPELGENVWFLWKKLRNVFDEVINTNLLRLRAQSIESISVEIS
jgi:hypothetical protein